MPRPGKQIPHPRSAPPELPPQRPRPIPKTSSVTAFLARQAGTEDFFRVNLELHETVDSLMKRELKYGKIDNDPDVIYTMIPKEHVPFDGKELYTELSGGKDGTRFYDGRSKTWHGFPGHNNPNQAITGYFEWLAVAAHIIVQQKFPGRKCRYWSNLFDKAAVPHPFCDRKPDAVHLPFDPTNIPLDALFAWYIIFSPGEFKQNEEARPEAIFQVADEARLIFNLQLNRRYVVGFILTGTLLSVIGLDRSGLVASKPFDINEEPGLFLHVIVGSLYLDEYQFGLDPTIRITDSKSKEIEVDGEWFDIIDVIHIEGGLRGRGTVCYHVRKGDKDYIVKDRWVDVRHAEREANILKKLSGLKHIPRFIKDVPVMFNGEKDTTAFLRQSEEARKSSEIREHRRMLLEPPARKLGQFRDLVELLTAIRNVVDAIEVVLEKGYVHRDISVSNIMLEEDGNELRGLLIDYDYATATNGEDKAADTYRTGTLPFMAVEVLEATETMQHRYYHDLESLLYVLIWISTMQSGPCGALRDTEGFEYHKSCLCIWNGGLDTQKFPLSVIADLKSSQMTDPEKFKKKVLDNFSEYFEPIKDCVWKLRRLLFTRGASEGESTTLVDTLHHDEFGPQLKKMPNIVMDILESMVSISRSTPKEFIGQYRKILDQAIQDLAKGCDAASLPPILFQRAPNPGNSAFYTINPIRYREMRYPKNDNTKSPRHPARKGKSSEPRNAAASGSKSSASKRCSEAVEDEKALAPSPSGGTSKRHKSSKAPKVSRKKAKHVSGSFVMVDTPSSYASSFKIIEREDGDPEPSNSGTG